MKMPEKPEKIINIEINEELAKTNDFSFELNS